MLVRDCHCRAACGGEQLLIFCCDSDKGWDCLINLNFVQLASMFVLFDTVRNIIFLPAEMSCYMGSLDTQRLR